MNETVLQEAMQQIQLRRYHARLEYEKRLEEVNQKIPPLAEINTKLARTSLILMDILRKGGDVRKQVEQLQDENLEAQHIAEQLLESSGYPTDYLDMHYICEKCQDTGYVNGCYCDCVRNLAASIGIAKMNQRAQMELSDFSQFSLEYYKGKTTDKNEDCYAHMCKVYNSCVSYADEFTKSSPSLLFYGGAGLGKTHLSLSIARKVIEKGYEVIYDSVINLLEQIEREHFSRENTEMDTQSLLLSVDLLILDDLGTEFSSSFNISALYNIINTRLNRGLPTIISTNLDYQGILRRYEERIVSRLFAVYKCMQFMGTDIRQMKKSKKQRKDDRNGFSDTGKNEVFHPELHDAEGGAEQA